MIRAAVFNAEGRGVVSNEEPREPFQIYAGLSTPAVIIDADYRIVYLNPSAAAFWETTLQKVSGQYPVPALRLAPPDGTDLREWGRDVVFPALAAADPFVCQVTGPGGREPTIRLSGTRFYQDGEWYTLLTVLSESQRNAPVWALTDPLTGLHNRHQWDREFPERNARAGVVIFLDLDNLKQINDLNGHRRGDQALIIAGKAIREHAPEGSLAVRYGGDEFVLVVDECQEEVARSLAERIVSNVAAVAEAAPGGVLVHVSYGVAAYKPGDLLAGVQRADEALYEQKGVLLRSAQGGRILLTSEARGRVLHPGSDAQKASGEFGKGFGSQFDGYFRQMYARAVEQAQEFVEFVSPRPGSAVVEVGAGSGRITLDGGLAERIGEQGQLLVTDPSAAQLQVARQRAESLGLSWVRFLAAPVEDLPVAGNSVDLVVGAVFLHFTDPAAAIRSMARVARPGGCVAINAGLDAQWGPAWQRACEPIWAALRERGLPPRDIFMPAGELERLLLDSGLVIERRRVMPPEQLTYPDADTAVGVARQARLAALYARDLPEQVRSGLEDAFDGMLRRAIEDLGPRSADAEAAGIYIIARKPA